MLQQLLAAAMRRKQEQDLVMRAIGAIVTRQGGVIKAVTGEELAALKESVGEEKH